MTESGMFNQFIQQLSFRRAAQIAVHILPWLEGQTGKILDFGSGLGHIGLLASQHTGAPVVYLDVKKYPYTGPGVEITLFDGQTIPFDEDEFDTALIVFVLHHSPDPAASLREVMRVTARRVIVCEDHLRSRSEIFSEAIKDTLANCFLPHMTFQYHTEVEWEAMFSDLGLEVLDKRYFDSRYIFHFQHVAWLLEV